MRSSAGSIRRAITAVLASLLVAGPAPATNYYAVVGGAGAMDGTSWENGHPDVQALAQSLYPTAASVTNQLWVGAGTWIMTNTMLPASNLCIRGTNRDLVILSGNFTCRVVRVVGDNVTLAALTIANGSYTGGYEYGCGIRGMPSTVVTDCVVSNNVATNVTGVGMAYGRAYDSVFVGNRGFSSLGTLANLAMVSNCVVSNNFVADCGGIYASTSRNCTVVGNVCSDYGGGLMSCNDRFSTIIENRCSTWGGGANNSSLYGTTFIRNTATYSGGAIMASVASNCVMISNYTVNTWGGTYSGGGASQSVLYNCYLGENSSPVLGGGASESYLYGCVLVSNAAPAYPAIANARDTLNCDLMYHTNKARLVQYTNAYPFYNNIVWGNASNGVYNTTNAAANLTNDPAFLAGTYMPTASDAIDCAAPEYGYHSLDFDGYPRTNGLAPDIGAVEYDARPMVIPYGSWETFYSALASRLSNKTNLTAGSLRVVDMPTSASGLEPGDLWWDGSNVRVVLP